MEGEGEAFAGVGVVNSGEIWVSSRDVMVLERGLTLMVYPMVDLSPLNTQKLRRPFQSL